MDYRDGSEGRACGLLRVPDELASEEGNVAVEAAMAAVHSDSGEAQDALDAAQANPSFVDEYDASLTKIWSRIVPLHGDAASG